MTERKLTPEHFERGSTKERFTHLQHRAGLDSAGRTRVDEAMKAAVNYVAQKHDLRYGMQAHHIDTALDFLASKNYPGRHDLKPHERDLVAQSFQSHFKVKEPEQGTKE